MKKILYSVILLLICSSCAPVWDMLVFPFSNFQRSNIQNIDKFYPKTSFFSCKIKDIDSLMSPKHAVNMYKIEHESWDSPLQTRMYDKEGNFAGAWEFCIGNAKYLHVYDSVPIKLSPWIAINKDLLLKNDISLLDIDTTLRNTILKQSAVCDYTIIVFWTNKLGYYTKRHLRQTKHYINKNKNYKFCVIYAFVPQAQIK